MNKIGDKIRIERLTKNYTQEYMAFMLEISQAAYSKLERNETEISLSRIYEIAEVLEVSPFVFMPKPKYGTGINQHFILRTLTRLKRVFSAGQKSGPMPMPKLEVAYSDISNFAG